MAKDKVGVNAGQYYVEVGKLPSGKQQRFYLGRVIEISGDEARVRRHRVREFWERLEVSTWSEARVEQAKLIGKGATTIVNDTQIINGSDISQSLKDDRFPFRDKQVFSDIVTLPKPIRLVVGT